MSISKVLLNYDPMHWCVSVLPTTASNTRAEGNQCDRDDKMYDPETWKKLPSD